MRDEITAYKRERILEEAVKLFYERGFSGTTLDDIAGKLGVTKPFIYTHFRSKVELLEAVCRPTIEMSLDAIANAAAETGSPAERLYNGIANFTKVILQRQGNIAVYFREEKHLSEQGLAEINALRKRFDRVLSELLQEGADSGAFRISDIRVAALAIGGMVSWAYTWYQPGGRLSFDEIAAKLAHFGMQMVEAQPLTLAARS
ncbi:MAG TPA: TetR/AcrR family transcriptional regulator [Alphaproteobacteria bacterium]|jgi:AcrR family transcriptional regulator|nr:TetR/AcrR family transcriptional regulator [Alphaproteobacteria bacterium]